jgi:hypothetical protein
MVTRLGARDFHPCPLILRDRIVVLSDKPSKVKRVIQNIYLIELNEENMVKMKMMLERGF